MSVAPKGAAMQGVGLGNERVVMVCGCVGRLVSLAHYSSSLVVVAGASVFVVGASTSAASPGVSMMVGGVLGVEESAALTTRDPPASCAASLTHAFSSVESMLSHPSDFFATTDGSKSIWGMSRRREGGALG